MATNPLALSDEDFLNAPPPEKEEASSVETPQIIQTEAPKTETPVVETPKEEDKTTEIPADKVVVVEEAPKEKELSPAEQAAANVQAETDKKALPSGSEPKVEAQTDPKPEAEAAPNYKELYEKMMAPFNANGKKIELKNPEELIQLAQMGANYTRKLQELAPQRKILAMLSNHDLLSEDKLSFLIALDKKDPEAIKKLIMDSGIDPLDIDTKIQPAYQEGSYQVSDEEVNFRTQLDELTSSDTGKQTLQDIEKTWDQASKDMLWQHPQVMSVIHEQRELGIYAKITEEMDRQKTLGKIAPTTPFLEAYKVIGDQLKEAGKFDDPAKSSEVVEDPAKTASAQQPAITPVIVTTRAATPKPTVDNSDKAGAASATRAVPGKAKEAVNFFAMSDDDFLKAGNLQGRI